MDIAELQQGPVTVIEIRGRIDSNTAKVFGDRLTNLIRSGQTRLVVDLKNIVYISSAGFRALLLAGRLAEETRGTLALCGLTVEIQRLFDLGAFTDLFLIFPSREEGLTKLS
jgi:anti-sigma B factor antagonist